MDLPSIQSLFPLVALLLIGLLLGYLLGSARALKKRRLLQRELNTKTVAALEGSTKLKKAHRLVENAQRQQSMVKLLMQQLRESKEANAKLSESLTTQERAHYISQARLKMETAEAVQRARKSTEVAQKATRHLQLLKQSVRATQTIEAPEPKSYGHGDSVPVSVVDQQAPDTRRQVATRVSNRDSQRLAQLRSSNEARLSSRVMKPSPLNAASLTRSVKKSSKITDSHTNSGV
ncbi:MAG: hypothetical protein KTR35_10435 [Gammaproteobacteria bacterium]|nr:hypothetical protein [Gammaproteobacteria bacterium]